MTPDALPPRAVGYLRVSTAEQADSGAGISAQRHVIEQEAARRGWELVRMEVDAAASGKSMQNRPALERAVGLVESAQADILVVAKLDRLSRSVADFASLLDKAQRRHWGLVALDLGVDTTTPAGELVANVMAAVAQWERRAIGQRTREGLAAKRAAGVVLGRPPVLDSGTVQRIVRDRESGRSLRAIGANLDRDRVRPAQGGARWGQSSVAAVLRSRAAQTDPVRTNGGVA